MRIAPRWLVGLVIAAPLLSAPAAIAGDTDLGTAGGVTYVVDETVATGTGVGGFAEAYCPLGTRLAGSGEFIPGFGADVRVNIIRPSDGPDANDRDDDAALIGIHNDASATAVVGSAYAVCLDGRFEYRSRSVNVPAGAEAPGTVRCPKSTYVTGGGASLDGASADAYLNSSYPVDSRDDGRVPDDGWRARAYNSGAERAMTVYAYCWRRRPEYRSYPKALEPGAEYGYLAGCRRNTSNILSAGLEIPGPAAEARFRTLGHPYDSLLDANDVPDDGMDINVANSPTGSDKTATVFAICKP